MKIIFAIKRLEDMAGGAERVFLQVATGLLQKGHDIELVSFDRAGAHSFYDIPSNMPWHKISIGDSSKPAGIFETARRTFALRTHQKATKPDIVVAFQHSMIIAAAFTGASFPLVGSEHIVPDHYKRRPLDYMLAKISLSLCKKITIVSADVLPFFPKALQTKMIVIPNPVNNPNVYADVMATSINPKTILSVGRMETQKDHATLIQSFARIAHAYPDWNLVIRGEGTLRKSLESLTRELKLEDRISLLPNKKDISEDYRKAQIFALASIYESFGLVVVEAMAAGLPTVGFAECPGVNTLIRHNENGILANSNDGRILGLAEALSKLMDDGDLRDRIGAEGKKHAQKYELAPIIDQWDKLLKDVVRQNSCM